VAIGDQQPEIGNRKLGGISADDICRKKYYQVSKTKEVDCEGKNEKKTDKRKLKLKRVK
jgi:hypothetical protein